MKLHETNSLTSDLFAAINTQFDAVRVRLPMPDGGEAQLRDELARFSAATGADVPSSLKVEGYELQMELAEFGLFARGLGAYFANSAVRGASPSLWQIDGSIHASEGERGHIALLVPSMDRDLSRVMTEQGPCAAVDLRDMLNFYKTDRTKFRDALQVAILDVVANLAIFPMRHFNDGDRQMITKAAATIETPKPTVKRGEVIRVDFENKNREIP